MLSRRRKVLGNARLPPIEQPDNWDEDDDGEIAPENERKSYYIIKHLFFPRFSSLHVAAKGARHAFGSTACVMIVSLENLYKIFERC